MCGQEMRLRAASDVLRHLQLGEYLRLEEGATLRLGGGRGHCTDTVTSELATNLCEDFTITEKAPDSMDSSFKLPVGYD